MQASGTQNRLNDVACLSALRCEAVGDAGTIVSTIDGGAAWQARATPPNGASSVLYRIACVAPSSCYVIARPDTVLVTHDGGATWTGHALPVGASSNLTDASCLPNYTPIGRREALCRLGLLDIACVSATVCYVIATTTAAYDVNAISSTTHAAPSSIWMTGDGGATWTSQPVPAGVACNGDCSNGLYGYPLVWISCLGSGVCRAGGGHVLGCGHCGFAYAVLVSRGPDTPWTCAASSPTCTSLAPDAADCPPDTSCYGIQSTNPFGPENIAVRSTDGGAGWVQLGAAWTTSVLSDIACPAELSCYVAGTGGTIARISGGTAVSAETTPTTADMYGIGCAGPAACYAVGDGGTILAGP